MCPLRRGEGGGHAPPGEGSFSTFATRQESDFWIRQTAAASPAEPGSLLGGLAVALPLSRNTPIAVDQAQQDGLGGSLAAGY